MISVRALSKAWPHESTATGSGILGLTARAPGQIGGGVTVSAARGVLDPRLVPPWKTAARGDRGGTRSRPTDDADFRASPVARSQRGRVTEGIGCRGLAYPRCAYGLAIAGRRSILFLLPLL